MIFVFIYVCRRWDLNPHTRRYTILSRTRLPIPPLRQRRYDSILAIFCKKKSHNGIFLLFFMCVFEVTKRSRKNNMGHRHGYQKTNSKSQYPENIKQYNQKT